jgi:hypothetical protein
MAKSDTPDDAFTNPDKPLFPAPPQGPEGVRLRLGTSVNVEVRDLHETVEDDLPSLSGFGGPNTNSRHVQVTSSEPVWLPEGEKGEEGKWKREVTFDSTMLLNCTPTFELDTIKCSVCCLFVYSCNTRRLMTFQYELHVEVTFPGLGNDLEFNVPIRLNSGFGPFNPNAGPPPKLDLPPYVPLSFPTRVSIDMPCRGSGLTLLANFTIGMGIRNLADFNSNHDI